MRFQKKTTGAFRNFLLAKYARLTGKTTLASVPYLLFMDPSSCCNLQCAMCMEDGDATAPPQRKRPAALMTPELFNGLMGEMGPYLFMISLYNWGEPLLNRHLPEFIRLAKSHDIYVDLNTNLSLELSDEQLRDFLLSGVDNVVVSIDGFSPHTYETYRKGGSFELAKGNLTRLAQLRDTLGLKTEITWKFLLFSFNEHEVELAREYCQGIGVTFAAKDAIIDLAKHAEWLPRHRSDESSRPHPGWPIARYYEPAIKAAGKENSCAWHYYYSAINADGTVSPCCAVDKVADDFGPLSDHHTFRELWNSERFRSARAALASCDKEAPAGNRTICHHCPHPFIKDLCSGTNKQVIDAFLATSPADPLLATGFRLLNEPKAFCDFMEKNMAHFAATAEAMTAPHKDHGGTVKGIDPGTCTVCGKQVVFAAKRQDFSLRETQCPACKASQRTRDLAQVILDTFGGSSSVSESLPALQQLSIYEAAASGPLHELLKALPGYVCSEFYDDVPRGGIGSAGVRCEDLERLTFADASFDLVITQDVFEHIANPWKAFGEIERVLKRGGSHIFTVPLHEGSRTLLRARLHQGKTDFLLPPVYHGDPLRPAGTLVYTDFGNDLGNLLTGQGFVTEIAHKAQFYGPSQIPLVVEESSYKRYLEHRQRGEMLAFFLYNSVVFRSEKSADQQGAPESITVPPLELAPAQLVLTGELAFKAGQVEAARSLFAKSVDRGGDSDG
ncbi:MAG TPA: methyltransferase domain-containing protein, partial [Geobacterales bacterium]|nr:methyltransferase domain-containing protein [Geobacterales bacterium]